MFNEGRVIPVEIQGQRYPIRSVLDPEYVMRLALYVDEKMHAAADTTPTGDSLRLAVLAALNIADELFRCRDVNHSRDSRFIERARVGRADAVTALPRHPFVVRDLSIVVADVLPAAIIRGTIQAAGRGGRAPLAAMTFFDRYQGKGVADGSVSVSVRLTFQAPDRTLTDADVQDSFDRILAALVREHGAVQR